MFQPSAACVVTKNKIAVNPIDSIRVAIAVILLLIPNIPFIIDIYDKPPEYLIPAGKP